MKRVHILILLLLSFCGGRLMAIESVDGDVVPVKPTHPIPTKRQPVTPLPRIGVRAVAGKPGEFYIRGTGKRFLPDGFNHTVLRDNWHATLDVGTYNGEEMEKVLSEIARLGGNSIRLWTWGRPNAPGGFCGKPTDTGLNGEYMENFVDFLTRATKHGIYVVAMMDETPSNAYYDSVARLNAPREPDTAIVGYNRQYLAKGPIMAKAAAIRDFISYVKAADKGLLSTVLGWEFCNEAFVNGNEGPFDKTSGVVTTANGKSYDMSNKDERQACWDDDIVYWANELTKAVRSVDKDAMVTVGMWTSNAQNRSPLSGMDASAGNTQDLRFCPRPSVLAQPDCRVDFLDIHIYPWGNTDVINKTAHEYDALCKLGKPVLVGEYGGFRFTPSETAKEQVRRMRKEAADMGYSGYLFWTWNLMDNVCYSAADEGWAELMRELFDHDK